MSNANTINNQKPEWLSHSECPEAVVDFLPEWKRALVLKLEKFRTNCLDCRQLSWSRSIEHNMSFRDNFQTAVEYAYKLREYMQRVHAIRVDVSENGRQMTIRYENVYGATSTIKINWRQ